MSLELTSINKQDFYKTTMKFQSYSLHKFSDMSDLSFNPHDYSRFKYGSKSIARAFGSRLGVQFGRYLEECTERSNKSLTTSIQEYDLVNAINSKQIVVVPSPYDFIGTATYAMKDYFISAFNEFLIKYNLPPVQETKVHRSRSYHTDYGDMNAEERKKAISADGFHIDKEFIKDKFVIFLDDIRISGGHENRMEEMVEAYGLECDYIYMYFAQMTSTETCPKLEGKLNLYAVDSLLSIDDIIKNDEFLFNTRVVKYILAAPEKEFCNFIAYQSDVFRKTLMHNLIGNRYHDLPEFKTNYQHLFDESWRTIVKTL